MPLSDVFIDEHFGPDITAIHLDRSGSTEEHVSYFRGGAGIWLSRAEVIARMQSGKKYYARANGWRGELELVQDESSLTAYLRAVPDAGGNTLLSLPRG